jgi:Fe-S oxidoreductase
MAFNELQIKVAAETAIMGLQPHMASLKYFAHNFKELEDKKGSAIAVPVYSLTDAADFDTNSNNWGSGENEIQGEVLNLEKHLIKSIGLDDVAAGATDINFLRDGTKAIVDVLAHAANKYVYGMINETNCPTSETFTGSDKTAFANLFKIASDKGVNPYEAVVILTPEYYAKVLSFLDAVVYSND